MKASKLEVLISSLDSLNKKQSDWIDKLPLEISGAFFDNPYTNASSNQINELLKFIFEDWHEDISYFLYEESPHKITTTKGDYVINNVKEYIDYMVCEGFVEDDRV